MLLFCWGIREVATLSRLQHQHVVRYYQVMGVLIVSFHNTRSGLRLYLVLPLRFEIHFACLESITPFVNSVFNLFEEVFSIKGIFRWHAIVC